MTMLVEDVLPQQRNTTDTSRADIRRWSTTGFVGGLIGTSALVLIWAWASQHQPELILPSPTQTWAAIAELFRNGTLLPQLGITMGRAMYGVGVAFAIGLIWGSCSGHFPWFAAITQPLLSTLMALPPVVLVALGVVWLGPGAAVTHIVVTTVALPLIVVAVSESVRNIDRDLLEMAKTFALSRRATIRHVVAPGITSPVLAATSVTIGQALRVAVMAELLSATDGIGAEVALSRTNLATADLFAWALVLVVTVIIVELVILKPLQRRLLRWRPRQP